MNSHSILVNFTSMAPHSDASYSGYRWLTREQDGLLSMSRHNRKMWRRYNDEDLARQIWIGTEGNWVYCMGDHI